MKDILYINNESARAQYAELESTQTHFKWLCFTNGYGFVEGRFWDVILIDRNVANKVMADPHWWAAINTHAKNVTII